MGCTRLDIYLVSMMSWAREGGRISGLSIKHAICHMVLSIHISVDDNLILSIIAERMCILKTLVPRDRSKYSYILIKLAKVREGFVHPNKKK